jgi:hypothetical protein
MLGVERGKGMLWMNNLGMATRAGEKMDTVSMSISYCSLPISSSAQVVSQARIDLESCYHPSPTSWKLMIPSIPASMNQNGFPSSQTPVVIALALTVAIALALTY